MKGKIIRCLLSVAATLCCASVSAQEFLWNIDFDYKFDNREYEGSDLDRSATHYGVRLSPEVGLGLGRAAEGGPVHKLMVGIDIRNDFGKKRTDFSHEMLVYYELTAGRWMVDAGRFPRSHSIGTYSNAIFSEWVSYYDSDFDGLLANWHGEKGYWEFLCDWNSMALGAQREKFMLLSGGEWRPWRKVPVSAGYNLSMLHHAGSEEVGGVVDNILVYPYLKAKYSWRLGRRDAAASLSVGWLQAFQNDRRYVGHYVRPGGVQIDCGASWYGFGLRNALYLGDNLMPYFDATVPGQPAYGTGLYYGEPFYRTSHGIYERLEIYWERSFGPCDVRIASVHHYDGRVWVWQQILHLQVRLDRGLFSRRR